MCEKGMVLRWLYLPDIDSIGHMGSDQKAPVALCWPGRRDVVRWVLGTAAMCAAFIGLVIWSTRGSTPAWTDSDYRLMITLLIGSGCLMLLMTFVLGKQRIEIHGTTILSANLKTLYRWRAIDAHEVVAMEVNLGSYESALAVFRLKLAPAPHRKWNQIEVFAIFGGSGRGAIDNRFFIPVAGAISMINPSLRIDYLPASYNGALNHLRVDRR